MRILAGLAVYFIFVFLGTDILGLLGLDVGNDYGMSISGEQNFSITGAATSFVIGLIAATALIILDEDGIGIFLVVAYWLYQIYGDHDDVKKLFGWLGFLIITLDNIIKLVTLAIISSAKDSIKKFYRELQNNSNDTLPPV